MKFSILLALLPVALATPIAVASPEAPASDIAARDACAEYNACVEQKGPRNCDICQCDPMAMVCWIKEFGPGR
ncbi:hypothetical protein ACSS6W_009762 [Trichoderma asperelloides]|nr:hypothetical protein LI328DRAFT_143154 [Trichoderma asperelloides]